MTKRLPCPPAPGPMEAYADRFNDLFGTLAQRRGFREYLAGLLLPRDRNATLTCLAGTEPVVGAQHAAVQRLQLFPVRVDLGRRDAKDADSGSDGTHERTRDHGCTPEIPARVW